jgi:hypothetical protein
MAHYAKVNPNGIVENVIVAEAEFSNTYVDSSAGIWIKTSYNTRGGVHYEPNSYTTPSADQSKALRMNYAGIGMTYDEAKDAFIDPQPFPSWTLNEDTCLWVAPIAEPDDGKHYIWNEALYQSDNSLGWEEE